MTDSGAPTIPTGPGPESPTLRTSATGEPGIDTKKAHGLSVLVVDECPLVTSILERILVRRGHRPRSARSCDEALAVLESKGFEPDLLLIDVESSPARSPGMVPRARTSRRGVRVLLMAVSGQGLDDDYAIIPLLRKPFGAEDLYKAIDELGA